TVAVFMDHKIHRRKVSAVVNLYPASFPNHKFPIGDHIKSSGSQIRRHNKSSDQKVDSDRHKRKPPQNHEPVASASQRRYLPVNRKGQPHNTERKHHGFPPCEDISLFRMAFPQNVFILCHVTPTEIIRIMIVHPTPP